MNVGGALVLTTIKAIRFSEEEIADIEEYAQQKNISYSEVVRKATKVFLASMHQKSLTVYSVVKLAKDENEDINLLYSQFLDDFAKSRKKESLISEEPDWPSGDNKIWPYLLAATVHRLAHENGIPVPKWALSEKYISPRAIYGMDTKNTEFQKLLEETTPMEFKSHNLFLGENVLSRY